MTNHFLLTTLAAASTLLAGCSLIPAYERPAPPVRPHYAGAADAAAAKPLRAIPRSPRRFAEQMRPGQ